MSDADLDAIDAEILAKVDEAVEKSIAAPFPDISELETDVYSSGY